MAQTGYQIVTNSDLDEGRGHEVVLPGVFFNREAAEQAAIGRGVFGTPAEVRTVSLFETVDEWKQAQREADPDYRAYLALKRKFEG